MVSGASGVISLSRIASVDWDNHTLAFDIYSKSSDFARSWIDVYPMHAYFSDIASADAKGRAITRIKARDARNLLKLLQRKLP